MQRQPSETVCKSVPESMAEDGRERVRAGDNDAACCPGELVDWQWTLGDGTLNALGTVRTGRLSLATLAGTLWVLRAWDVTDPAGAEPVVTLAYDAGRFTGASGCNRYFAGVEGGSMPGENSQWASSRYAHGLPGAAILDRGTVSRTARRCQDFGFMRAGSRSPT